MPGTRDDTARGQCRHLVPLVGVLWYGPGNTVIRAVQSDNGDVYFRPLRQAFLHVFEPGLTWSVAYAMAIGMNHHIYEIWIIE